jgi:hypothetical protein
VNFRRWVARIKGVGTASSAQILGCIAVDSVVELIAVGATLDNISALAVLERVISGTTQQTVYARPVLDVVCSGATG